MTLNVRGKRVDKKSKCLEEKRKKQSLLESKVVDKCKIRTS